MAACSRTPSSSAAELPLHLSCAAFAHWQVQPSIFLVTPDHLTALSSTYRRELSDCLNELGLRSAIAQGLKAPITTTAKFLASGGSPEEQSIFLAVEEGGRCVGLLKTGRRTLFVYNKLNKLHEITPLCALDFYVEETERRKGWGLRLFQAMLGRNAPAP